jgi:glycogen synthase
MNILFLCREYDRKVGYGGIGTYVDIVSRYLAKIGHKVFIICSIPRKTEEIVEKDNLVIYYAKQVHIKGIARLFKILDLESVYSRLMCALTNYLAYKKLSKKYKIDIVETPEWYNEGLFFVLQKKIPVVCRIHGANFQLSRFIRKKGFFSKINDFLSNFF